MKPIRAIGYIFVSLLLLAKIVQVNPAYAQSASSSGVKVKAQVGEFALFISGYISPFASLSLIANDAVLRGAVADENGRFIFKDITINKGFYQFCISAVDWKRFGESYSCYNIEPAKSDVALHDLFLPPTIGVRRAQIVEGSDASVLGLSMPYASVTVRSGVKKYEVKADKEGYYEYTLKSVPRGSYTLVADALYEGKKSEPPVKGVTFKAIAYSEYIAGNVADFIKRALSPRAFLWYLLLLGSIGLLVALRYPEETLIFFHLKPKRLHHWWFVGY